MGNSSLLHCRIGLGLVIVLGIGATLSALGCAIYSGEDEDVTNEDTIVIGETESALYSQVSERWRQIVRDGNARGFRATSTTGGRHNRGSLHGQGRAVDFSVRHRTSAEVDRFIREMRGRGYNVRDERTRPRNQRVWTGPHIHVDDRRR